MTIKTDNIVKQTFCDSCNKLLATGPIEDYEKPNTVYPIHNLCWRCQFKNE